MIDIHSHILAGLDDGAVDLGESLGILREMVDDGVRAVVATPHVRSDYPTTPDQMREAHRDLVAAVAADGLPIAVLPGGELAVDALTRLSQEDRSAFALGGREWLLLLEMPYSGWSSAVADSVSILLAEGITPVLAHPERNPAIQEKPELLAPFVRAGAVIQITASSLAGRLGSRPAASAKALIAAGLVHIAASDAHGPGLRRSGLATVAAHLDDSGLAAYLTVDAPAALLEGEPLPAAPARTRRRWRAVRGRVVS